MTGRVHQRLVTVLIVLASVVGTVGVFAVWLDRQALNTDEWTATSGKLLEDPEVRGAVATYEADLLYANVDVARELGRLLPEKRRALAGPAAAGLRLVIQQAAQRALGTPIALEAWRRANLFAHRQLLAVIDGRDGPVLTSNGTVTLDLKDLVQQVGGWTHTGISLSADSAQVKILHSDRLETAQKVARGIRAVALFLVLLGVGLYVAALALARGWRRVALRNIGLGVISAGLLALIARGVIGGHVVDRLSQNDAVRPAASAVWSIGTSLLSQTAIFLVIDGLLLVAAAAIAGPTPIALSLRRLAAPYLRDRPVATYACVAIVFGLLVSWGPTLALREPISLVAIAALMVVGTESLRRQVAREFPADRTAAVDAGTRWRQARRRIGDGLARMKAAFSHPRSNAGASGNGHGAISASELAVIGQLADLRDRGALTEEEFAQEKGHVLSALGVRRPA
ncbi:MAG TPA: SHOCT domain-containing protein [Thermoleophilaceae bacterium]|nr:SHOCT domain-containing protein [Thermoleophilaceae bacterium]